jgi:hypothetical protein
MHLWLLSFQSLEPTHIKNFQHLLETPGDIAQIWHDACDESAVAL